MKGESENCLALLISWKGHHTSNYSVFLKLWDMRYLCLSWMRGIKIGFWCHQKSEVRYWHLISYKKYIVNHNQSSFSLYDGYILFLYILYCHLFISTRAPLNKSGVCFHVFNILLPYMNINLGFVNHLIIFQAPGQVAINMF